MTMPAAGIRYSYAGNGVTTDFSYPRSYVAKSDVDVYLVSNAGGTAILQTLNVDYTLTNPDPSGGTVSFITAPSSAYTVVITRSSSAVQPLDLDNVSAFSPSSIEKALDRLSALAAEAQDLASRAVRLPDYDTASLSALALAAQRAGQLLGFDAITGDLKLYPITPTGTFTGILGIASGGTGSPTAAGARTALGLGTAAVENIGTSGNVVGKLNVTNTWAPQILGGGSSVTGVLNVSANNSAITGTPLNRVVFKNTDPTTAADEPTGELRWETSDANADAALIARIIARTVNGTGGGRLEFYTAPLGALAAVKSLVLDENAILRMSGFTQATFTTLPKMFVYSAAATNTGAVGAEYQANSNSQRFHLTFSNLQGVAGSISTTAGATAFNTSSDYRLKENLAPMNDAVARVMALNPLYFTWKADPDAGVWEGMLAHELATVVPTAVAGPKDGVDEEGTPSYQSVDYSKLIPLLTAALQAAHTEIAALKTRVTALEG